MKRTQLLGIIRHVLTFGGGFVVAKGWGSEALVTEITGALMTLIGGIWSIASPEKQPA